MKMSLIAMMMGAASTSETSVKFYHATRRNKTEDSHLEITKLLWFSYASDYLK
jgi:hypothetical protein